MRICIFGTSHLAAPRLAYQSEPDRWADLDITFVGATGTGLLDHTINDGVMTPTTPELAENFQLMAQVGALDLRRFDAFALIGCQIGPHMIGHIYGQARWCSLRSVKHTPQRTNDKHALISEPLLDDMLRHRMGYVVGGRLARILRAATDRPILISSCPRPSEELMEMKQHQMIALKRAVKKSDARHLSNRFDRVATEFFDGAGVKYLRQPNRTITNHLLTRPAYSLGAIKLTASGQIPQPDNDITHGNRLYGEVVLDQINGALADMEK